MNADTQSSRRRWVLVLPPSGGARLVGQELARAFAQAVNPGDCKIFDTQAWEKGLGNLLRAPAPDMLTDFVNQSLAVQAFDFQAGRVLVMALSPVTLFTLNLLRKYRIVTLHWFVEDFNRAAYWKQVAAGYDHFCAIQKEPLASACAAAGTRVHFVPTATGTAAASTAAKTRDVVFIGIPSPYRIAVLERIVSAGIAVAIAGSGWESCSDTLKKSVVHAGWIEGKAAADLLASARIGLNLSVEQPGGNRQSVHISPRLFDIAAAGLVPVTEDVPLLQESFPGVEAPVFTGPDEAEACIRAVLDRYDDYSAAALRNARAVAESHTYINRARQFIRIADGQ